MALYLIEKGCSESKAVSVADTALTCAIKAGLADVALVLLQRNSYSMYQLRQSLLAASQVGALTVAQVLLPLYKTHFHPQEDLLGALEFLQAACQNNNSDSSRPFIEFLLAEGCPLDRYGIEGLKTACQHGNMVAIQALVSAGASVSEVAADEEVVNVVAQVDNWRVLRYLIDNSPAEVFHAERIKGVLSDALFCGSAKSLKVLLNRTHITDRKALLSDCTPPALHTLALCGHKESLHSPRCKNDHTGYLRTIKWLLKKQFVEIDGRDKMGRTALSMASLIGHLEVATLLVGEGKADPNAGDNYNNTPLFISAMYGDLQMVEYLVEKARADVNVISGQEDTPLSAAHENQREEVASYLSEKGAMLFSPQRNEERKRKERKREDKREERSKMILEDGKDKQPAAKRGKRG